MGTIVDVAVGVILLYLLLSLFVTTIQELVATTFRLRSKALHGAIADMLRNGDDGKALAQKLYAHPLMRNLTNYAPNLAKGPELLGKGLPSYIPSKTFALALVDVLNGTTKASDAVGVNNVLAQGHAIAEKLPKDSELRATFSLLLGDLDAAAGSVDERARLASQRLEGWFNDRMARASGWYKRGAQTSSLVISLLVAVTFNADSIYFAQRLWHDSDLRTAVANNAQAFYDRQTVAANVAAPGAAPANTAPASATPVDATAKQDTSLGDLKLGLNKAIKQREELNRQSLPIGWRLVAGCGCVRPDAENPEACWTAKWHDLLFLGFGWLITGLAISLGAGFWFEILGKALQLRGGGPRISTTTGTTEGDA